jgi:hypothetical protein
MTRRHVSKTGTVAKGSESQLQLRAREAEEKRTNDCRLDRLQLGSEVADVVFEILLLINDGGELSLCEIRERTDTAESAPVLRSTRAETRTVDLLKLVILFWVLLGSVDPLAVGRNDVVALNEEVKVGDVEGKVLGGQQLVVLVVVAVDPVPLGLRR